MRLTLITVNYNNARATVELLRSLERQTQRDFELIIIDNESSEQDRMILGEIIAASPLNVRVHWNTENKGFAAGSNIGILLAFQQGADWAVLINNDALVGHDAITSLVQALAKLDPGVVALPLLEHGAVVRAGLVRWLSATLPHTVAMPHQHDHIYAVGGGMAIHRTVFQRIGLLDERYFLYFEDAEYSERARAAGFPILVADIPALSHEVSATTSKLGSPLLLRYHMRNALLFNSQNGPWWVKTLVPLWALWNAFKQIVKLCIGRERPQSAAILAGIFDFVFGRWGKVDTRTHIGIECEQIEGPAWGIGHTVLKLLKTIADQPELRERYHFHLYFKASVPDFPWLANPIFTTHVVSAWLPYKSFVFNLYVFLPIRLWFTRLDAMFYPNYMLPIIHPPWTPSLTLLTDDIWHEMRSARQRPHHRLAYWVFSYWAVWRATKILAISESSKNELVRLFHIAPERIAVAHLAADIPTTCNLPTGQAGCQPGNYLLYVAQAFPRRHLRETVQAFEKIAPNFPDLKFIAIGPNRYRTPLNIRNERIIRKEHVSADELAELYAYAKVFVYVSDREAFGLPPLEALSYGVPSVLADKPISREIFGDNAFFVTNPNSPDSIASAITDALTNNTKREAIRTAAPAILARFTWSRFADRWLKIIYDMIVTQ